jgi:hypothetical protein
MGRFFSRMLIFAAGLACLLIVVGLWGALRPLPDGVPFRGVARPAPDVRFLADVTFVDAEGRRRVRQGIFNEALRIISRAESFILLDMFLFNEFQGPKPESTRKLSSELANALIKRKSEAPGIRIMFITDPINTVYGGMRSAQLEALRAAGVEVVVTRLERLRDSNPLYSALWRVFIRPFGNSVGGKRMKNPFGEGRVSLRSWLKLMNFKANHRKVLLADAPGEPGDGWGLLRARTLTTHRARTAISLSALQVKRSRTSWRASALCSAFQAARLACPRWMRMRRAAALRYRCLPRALSRTRSLRASGRQAKGTA